MSVVPFPVLKRFDFNCFSQFYNLFDRVSVTE